MARKTTDSSPPAAPRARTTASTAGRLAADGKVVAARAPKEAVKRPVKSRATTASPPEVAAASDAPRRRRAVANAEAALTGRALRPWTAAEVETAFARFAQADPEPKGELDYVNPFTLLVAVVLSAQATDVGVNRATRGLFAAAETPAAMVALGEEGVAGHIRTLGLYRGKAKNVVALSRLLLEHHGGEVPREREALEALPGVGRKTANVVLNIAFGLPTIAVDTHLFRVANRTGLAPGKTPLEVELGLEARIAEPFKLHAHHWLILHGRYVCKARAPECPRCLIADLCRWPEKTGDRSGA